MLCPVSRQEHTVRALSRMNEVDAKIAEILNVPEGKWVRSIIPFGVPEKEVAQKAKKGFDERVVWDRF